MRAGPPGRRSRRGGSGWPPRAKNSRCKRDGRDLSRTHSTHGTMSPTGGGRSQKGFPVEPITEHLPAAMLDAPLESLSEPFRYADRRAVLWVDEADDVLFLPDCEGVGQGGP